MRGARAHVNAIHKYLQDGILDVLLACEGQAPREAALGRPPGRGSSSANKHQKWRWLPQNTTNRMFVLLLYAYHETEQAHSNLLHYLSHGAVPTAQGRHDACPARSWNAPASHDLQPASAVDCPAL